MMTPELQRLRDALQVLMTSDWFEEEMENGNYHGAYEFLMELWLELGGQEQ